MSYEELTLRGFINEMKNVSTGPHPRKFCFVLGAGASKTSRIKSGQELVNIWEKELVERNPKSHEQWKKDLGITEENKYGFYSQYYERRYQRCYTDGYNDLEKMMENAQPSVGYVMLAYLLTETNNNVVITTNFDHLTEDAINYYAQKTPLVIGHEALAHYVTRKANRPTVIKIHRDLLLDPKNKSEELEKLHENWEKALECIFLEYHPVFIGYAGNDPSLMDFLIIKSEKFLNNEWKFPYWLKYKDDKIEGKVLEFLNKSKGYCIKHEGFDEFFYLLGAEFGYKLLPKEQFLGDAEKRYQKLNEAIASFTQENAASNGKESEGDSETTEILQAIQQVTDHTEVQRLYRESVVLHNAGKYEEALQVSEKVVKLAPDNARYQDGLGVTLHELGRYEEALQAKEKAIELAPDNARYQNSLGVTLHELGRYEEALQASQKAVELAPDNAMYQDSLSNTLHKMGRYEEALQASQKAIELEPDNARYQNGLGVTLHVLRRYEEALQAKEKAVELVPDNARSQNSLGVTLHELGRYEEALQAKEKAVEMEPDNARYQNSLGVTLHVLRRYEEALQTKEKAVEMEPDNAMYQNSLGVTLHKMERYEEALQAYQKAVEIEPDNAKYRDNLTRIQEQSKKGKSDDI